ncbi:MAG: hypothetical protein MUP81_03690 [Dehalococcoidia bacterium]|nr:hypothetical protein [Dehalococcoidia bacterium]
MPFWGTKDGCYSQIQYYYSLCDYYLNDAFNHEMAITGHYNANQDHLAIQDIIYWCSDIRLAIRCLEIRDNAFSPTNAIPYYLNNYVGGGVTMLDILAVMSVATAEELKAFIAVTDAYRAALWDMPYDSEYYALFVRYFKSWH